MDLDTGSSGGIQQKFPRKTSSDTNTTQPIQDNSLAINPETMFMAFVRPAQTSSLFKLPQELHDNIHLHLPRKDLSSLAKTCTTLSAATLPSLYGEIVVDFEFDETDWRIRESPETLRRIREIERQIRALERTISGSAVLAGMIKTLQINRATTSSNILDSLLPHTWNLTTLVYDIMIDQLGEMPDSIDGQRLSNQLNHVKDTLTLLKITYELVNVAGEFAKRHVFNNCSVSHLSELRTLDIPLDILLGWEPANAPKTVDTLPRSLITLIFGEDAWNNDRRQWRGSNFVPMLLEFVEGEQRKESTPCLKTFAARHESRVHLESNG